MHSLLRASLFPLTAALLAGAAQAATPPAAPLQPKVMLVAMFAPEAQTWIDRLKLTHKVAVDGLSADYPDVLCNEARVCLMTTGMGHANAAASTLALTLSPKFDLKHTYFLIAGIAGISPKEGTLGTTAWARYLVDFGIQWELDPRDVPKDWPTGYLRFVSRPTIHSSTTAPSRQVRKLKIHPPPATSTPTRVRSQPPRNPPITPTTMLSNRPI